MCSSSCVLRAPRTIPSPFCFETQAEYFPSQCMELRSTDERHYKRANRWSLLCLVLLSALCYLRSIFFITATEWLLRKVLTFLVKEPLTSMGEEQALYPLARHKRLEWSSGAENHFYFATKWCGHWKKHKTCAGTELCYWRWKYGHSQHVLSDWKHIF